MGRKNRFSQVGREEKLSYKVKEKKNQKIYAREFLETMMELIHIIHYISNHWSHMVTFLSNFFNVYCSQ